MRPPPADDPVDDETPSRRALRRRSATPVVAPWVILGGLAFLAAAVWVGSALS